MKFSDTVFFSKNDDKNLNRLAFFTIVVYIVSIFYNLHISPLYAEEPRRALVALEMLLNNNFIVTTLLDETFWDHPPLWNIILAGSLKIFGFNTFALRFPSAFSLLLTGLITYIMGKKYISHRFGILSALYYLVSADLYFYFSVTAEIDIFYSLLVLLSIYSVFHFYQKKQFYLLFGCAYFFITLAFLTKGFASYAFVIITLTTYFYYQNDLKRLLSIPHLLCAGVSILMVGLYFYMYGQYEDLGAYVSEMWGLTSQRTVLGRGWGGLIRHLLLFPLNFLGVLFPATLFLLFFWKKEAFKNIRSRPYLVFLGLIFLANFLVYLVSPGARIRYTYMFFPMAITVLTFPLFLQLGHKNWRNTSYHTFFQILIMLSAFACFFIPFLDYFKALSYLKYTGPFFGVLLLAIFFMHKNTAGYARHLFIINFIIICRLVFDQVALPMKAVNSSSVPHKMFAQEIRAITGDQEPLYVFSQEHIRNHDQVPFRFYETAAYLELWRKKLVEKTQQCEIQGYYIFNVVNLEGRQPLYSFTIGDINLALVRIE
ncbi:ArnT family glycosyltransferase [Pareuzebyella sediminis]|uniref:ArnT family glycosyltransferase n=1 Tax=Pareuzebyella sediminis TaxID=2607998 RepID=UPI0011EF2ADB|nr:glycosyltransferase family 39 protein [Pareuzebyella sediminis]